MTPNRVVQPIAIARGKQAKVKIKLIYFRYSGCRLESNPICDCNLDSRTSVLAHDEDWPFGEKHVFCDAFMAVQFLERSITIYTMVDVEVNR